MELLAQVPGWSLDNGHLARIFELESAGACITFFTEVMDLSTQEGHFPDISMKESRYVEVQFYTYPAGGMTLNDFIMAAKLNVKRKTL
jgi:4a-hydroxytetrahydrobiopterin dehydratase